MVHEHETEEQMEHVEGMPEGEPANGFHAPAELHVPAAADDTADDDSDVTADDDSDAPIELEGEGDHVTISQNGANRVDARTVTVSQGGVGQVRADELSISQGGIGLARVDSLTVEDGGSAFAVMADSASVEQGASVFLLVARSATGDVRPVLDWRTGLAIGAGVGLVLALLRRFR